MKSIESMLKATGYKATSAGLLRIAIWAVLFLSAAGLFLPPKVRDIPFTENVTGLAITPLITLPSDPAFVNPDAPQTPADLKIAWISDSSSVIYKPGAKFLDFSTMGDNNLLPVETLSAMTQKGLENLHIDLFARLSLRSLEAYTLTELALERNPDVIVLTLNPFFVFNNHAVFKGNSHFTRAGRAWAYDTHAWPWLALFPSPSDHLWALLSRHFTMLSQAPLFAHEVQGAKTKLWSFVFPPLLNQNTGKSSAPKSGEGLKENAMIFWVTQRILKGDLSKLVNDKNEAINAKWYRQLIRLTDLNPASFNYTILIRTLDKIKASGKKSVIYLAPVSENLREDPDAWSHYQSIKKELNTLKKHYESENLHLIVDLPADTLNGTVFVKDDDVHLNAAGGLPNFLADEISRLLPPETGALKQGQNL